MYLVPHDQPVAKNVIKEYNAKITKGLKIEAYYIIIYRSTHLRMDQETY